MIDTFAISHFSGPCGNFLFNNHHFLWANRSRIVIASGERIRITLYGHGADLAQDATGSNIYEWISARGTTTHYPGAPIMFGGTVSKGYVTIDVRAASAHGLGNRTVTVKWLTGNETLNLKIVASCSDVSGATHRSPVPGGSTFPGIPPHIVIPHMPDLMPALLAPVILTRPLPSVPVIATPGGGMFQVNDFFGSGLSENVVTTVPVPRLTWGVSGDHHNLPTTQFDVQLIDVSDAANPRVLDTLSLPQGFPANTPLVTRDNYPSRQATIRVIRNPKFQIGEAVQKFIGCFTEPGSTQLLDPTALLLIVDASNRIDEGNNENNNELRF